jgi:hypothetical protein
MLKMKLILSGLLAFALFFASCQTKYDVGFSNVSIEPTDETVSLALSGYASPYLGRFTLTWDDVDALPDVVAMTQLNGEIYLVRRNGELSVIKSLDPLTVRNVGDAGRIKYLAGYKELLYGVTGNGVILTCNHAQNLQWEKVGYLQKVTSFAASIENLYATTADGILWMGTISGKDLEWNNLGQCGDIISLTCDTRKLYAVTSAGHLMQRPLKRKDAEWLRMGYNNGDTYTIDAKHVVHASGKLYALVSDGRFYRSRHSTAGDLSARAMAIRNGKSTVVIAGVDVCGIDYSLTQSIKQEINQRRAIPVEAIMINASHTHFAPVTQKWLTWAKQNQLPDSLYLNHVVRKGIIQAIEKALDCMEPSYLYFGRDTTDIGMNRSLKGELALYDHVVDVLKVTSTNGQIKSLVFLTGCHPVFTDPTSGSYTASANYPGHARNMIEEKTGAVNTIFLQGCASDINPKKPFKTSGEQLAGDVISVLDKEMAPVKGNIYFAMDSLQIPTHPWTKEEVTVFKEANMGKPGDIRTERNVYWADIMLDYYQKGTMPGEMPIYIQTLHIGDWTLVGLSREVTTEYGLAIRRIWPDKKISVAAYTNDVSSYLATDPHIEARDYEGYDSFFWYAQPSPFPVKVFDTVIEYIKNNILR